MTTKNSKVRREHRQRIDPPSPVITGALDWLEPKAVAEDVPEEVTLPLEEVPSEPLLSEPPEPPELLPSEPPELLPSEPPELLPSEPPELIPDEPPAALPSEPPPEPTFDELRAERAVHLDLIGELRAALHGTEQKIVATEERVAAFHDEIAALNDKLTEQWLAGQAAHQLTQEEYQASLQHVTQRLHEALAQNQEYLGQIAELQLTLSDQRNNHSHRLGQMMTEHEQYVQTIVTANAQMTAQQIANLYEEIRSLGLWELERSSKRRDIAIGASAQDAIRRVTLSRPETEADKIVGVRALNQKVIV